jgi:hypothetical protein
MVPLKIMSDFAVYIPAIVEITFTPPMVLAYSGSPSSTWQPR